MFAVLLVCLTLCCELLVGLFGCMLIDCVDV